MCSKPDDEEQEIYFSGENDNTPITSSTQTLDLLALHLPPEKLVPYLVSKRIVYVSIFNEFYISIINILFINECS